MVCVCVCVCMSTCVCVCVCVCVCMHEHTQGGGRRQGAAVAEQVRKITRKVSIEKLEGPEPSEAFVTRWKLGTGMIPKQKNLPRDPVL